MLLITGKIFRNSLKFYEVLISDKYESRYKKVGIEGQTVYLLSDETAWMFTKTDIPFLRKNYVHISAADVSENWALTSKLQAQEEELREKTLELKATISNLHILSKEKEIENAKVRAHDIIGQRLTVLLRMLQNRDNLDYGSLTSLSKGLLEELKEEEIETKAEDELKKIQQIFNIIGVEVIFQGQLPHDEEDAQLFVDIIREGTANAVRHGFATQVKVEAEESEGSYNLVVANIGYTRDEPITLGSGLKAMRKKVNDQGGSLEIIHYPVFTLAVCLPGGEKSG
jgi:glucose-6-phosphate-specific signal transduction histidine kinase